MTHVAKGVVWASLDEGRPGYVGRAPRGNFVKVAKRGDVLTDEQVAELGLDDLEDHTDYDAILAAAEAAGAPITVREPDPDRPDRERVVVTTGPPEAEIVEVPHPHLPGEVVLAHVPPEEDE